VTDHRGGVPTATTSRIDHVADPACRDVDGLHHTLYLRSNSPVRPSIEGFTADEANRDIAVPGQPPYPAGLRRPTELTKGLMGEVQLKPRPVWTAEPPLCLDI
jgi:hypothetical protein